ncbi:hypothetical protein [Leptolyngbya sp. FACHB-711]|uniref:hypothetical protein n=1 Tax=unclassified Leptolyngbya TaxID=2650499 RepID=UPI0016856013|nr:hypothetical protein [Leptolyngbya sp. FACHB-711]MBD1848438.1 hypothetical protein [Cyanobacteria bacterium FACHB-502]MBD2024166.1 hypothetical protein [Leptolyngbya sp. FACHB-711]
MQLNSGIKPKLHSTGKANPSVALPTPEQQCQMMEGTIATQFKTIAAAEQGTFSVLPLDPDVA